jgi:chromosome segregation ATPase
MDVQVAKLNEGATQVAETVERIESLTAETAAQLNQATQAKESLEQEVAKLDQGRSELTDFVRGYIERLAVERKQMDSFDQRVKSFQAGLVTTQANINRLQEKEKTSRHLTSEPTVSKSASPAWRNRRRNWRSSRLTWKLSESAWCRSTS